jgi:hypothetical protein
MTSAATGSRPATYPVRSVVNLKTAKALGLELPPTWLRCADEELE